MVLLQCYLTGVNDSRQVSGMIDSNIQVQLMSSVYRMNTMILFILEYVRKQLKALLTAYFVLVFLVLRRRSSKRQTVLLVGLCDAGKSLIFSRVRFHLMPSICCLLFSVSFVCMLATALCEFKTVLVYKYLHNAEPHYLADMSASAASHCQSHCALC